MATQTFTRPSPQPLVPPPSAAPDSPNAFQIVRRGSSLSPLRSQQDLHRHHQGLPCRRRHRGLGSSRIHEAVQSLTGAGRRYPAPPPARRAPYTSRTSRTGWRSRPCARKSTRSHARTFLYREERAQQRRRETPAAVAPTEHAWMRCSPGGELAEACKGLDGVSTTAVLLEARRNLYDGTLLHEVDLANGRSHARGRDTMPNRFLGLSSALCVQFMHFIANRRCAQIGLRPVFSETENPFPRMSEAMDLKQEKNFFETQAIEHQNGGSSTWD